MFNYTVEHLEDLLDLIAYPIYMYDTERLHVYLNQRGAEVIGQNTGMKNPKKETIGTYIGDVWPHNWIKGIAQNNTTIFEKKESISRLIPVQIQGKPQIMKTLLSPILNDEGSVKLIFAIYIRVYNEIFIEKQLKPDYDLIEEEIHVGFNDNEVEHAKDLMRLMTEAIVDTDQYAMLFSTNLMTNRYECVFNKNCTEEMIQAMSSSIEANVLLGIHEIDHIENKNNQQFFKEKAIKSIGYYPIRLQEEKIGILIVCYEEPDVKRYGKEKETLNTYNKMEHYIKTLILVQKLQGEIQYKEEMKKHRVLFTEATEDLICTLDETGAFVDFNLRGIQQLGYEIGELKQYKFQDLIEECDYQELQEDHIQVITAKIKSKNNTSRWMDWKIIRKEVDGRIMTMAHGRDVTNQRVENQKYKDMRMQLKKEKAKSDIYATLSHEFKTPINIILASCRMLRNLEEMDMSVVDQIEWESYGVLKQVNDMIDLTKLDTGFYTKKLNTYNIVQLVEGVIEAVANYMGEKGEQLVFDTLEEEIMVEVDREVIERILFNILAQIVASGSLHEEILIMTNEIEEKIVITISYKSEKVGDLPPITPIISGLLKIHKSEATWEQTDGQNKVSISISRGRISEPYLVDEEEAQMMNRQRCKMEFAWINTTL